MKNIKIITLVIISVSTLGFFTEALAVVPIAKGYYIDADVGITNTGSDSGSGSSSSNALGYNINAGYKFMPFFGIEAGYTSYGTSTSLSLDSLSGDHEMHFVVKGIVPFQEVGIDLFAKVGATHVIVKGNGNANGLFYGFGADYFFTPQMAVIVQWTQAKASNTSPNLTLLSAGVEFLF